MRRREIGSGTVLRVELEAVRLRVPFSALDLATTDEFLRWTHEQLHAGERERPAHAVLLDLGDVEFVMAAGVQALLDLEDELSRSGRTLAVVDAAPIVTRVLGICGVADRWIVV